MIMEKKTPNIFLTRLEAEHQDRVMEIFRNSIENEDVALLTRVPKWEEWDQTHDQMCRIAAFINGEIIGFAAVSNVYAGDIYEGVGELSIYVDSGYRRNGVGYILLKRLITLSESCHYHTLQARIFPENGASISLHEKAGFRFVGVREKIAKKNSIWRDVYVFERRSPLF